MEIDEAIKQMAGNKSYYQHIGKVTDVNLDKRTCTVELRNDDADLQDVRLQAMISEDSGVVFIPEINSDVIVGYLDENEAYILKTSKVSKVEIKTSGEVILNGDKFGGLIKIEKLKTELAKVTQRIDTVIDILKNTVPSASLYPNPAWSGIVTPILSVLQKESYSEIENETVKHG